MEELELFPLWDWVIHRPASRNAKGVVFGPIQWVDVTGAPLSSVPSAPLGSLVRLSPLSLHQVWGIALVLSELRILLFRSREKHDACGMKDRKKLRMLAVWDGRYGVVCQFGVPTEL